MGKAKEYLSTREIAEMLGVHVRTVGNWIRRGDLVAVRLDKSYRVSKQDLNAFLEERRTNRKG